MYDADLSFTHAGDSTASHLNRYTFSSLKKAEKNLILPPNACITQHLIINISYLPYTVCFHTWYPRMSDNITSPDDTAVDKLLPILIPHCWVADTTTILTF